MSSKDQPETITDSQSCSMTNMKVTCRKYLPILIIVTGETISVARAFCSKYVSHQDSTNGCSYPACIIGYDDDAAFKCVHDESFCPPNQIFLNASEVLEVGKSCTCKDILNYPQLIGTCFTNGMYSPMLIEDDCVNGTSVCSKDASNNFLEGDEAHCTAHPFTACDLQCDFEKEHAIEVPKDTYKGCSFPKFDWYVDCYYYFIMNSNDWESLRENKPFLSQFHCNKLVPLEDKKSNFFING